MPPSSGSDLVVVDRHHRDQHRRYERREHEARERPFEVVIGHERRRGDRADDAREVVRGRLERDGARHVDRRGRRWPRARSSRVPRTRSSVPRPSPSASTSGGVIQPGAVNAARGPGQHRDRAVAREHDPLAVEAVGRDARERRERERGNEQREEQKPSQIGSLWASSTIRPWSPMCEIQKPVWLTMNAANSRRYERWARARNARPPVDPRNPGAIVGNAHGHRVGRVERSIPRIGRRGSLRRGS